MIAYKYYCSVVNYRIRLNTFLSRILQLGKSERKYTGRYYHIGGYILVSAPRTGGLQKL